MRRAGEARYARVALRELLLRLHKTVLLITHRPTSLAVANRLIRIEDGRVLP